MIILENGNDIIARCLTAARFYYSTNDNDDHMRGWFDGQLLTILVYIGVDDFIYQGVANEIRYLQRRAAEHNGWAYHGNLPN